MSRSEIHSAAEKKSYKDKRRHRRMEMMTSAKFSRSLDGVRGLEESIEVVNMSRRGACLMHIAPMRRGEQFLLWLPTRNGAPTPAPIRCRVAHCRTRASDGSPQYTIGVEFVATGPANNEDVQSEEIQRIRRSILD